MVASEGTFRRKKQLALSNAVDIWEPGKRSHSSGPGNWEHRWWSAKRKKWWNSGSFLKSWVQGFFFFFFFFEGRVNSGYDDKHRIEMIWRKRKWKYRKNTGKYRKNLEKTRAEYKVSLGNKVGGGISFLELKAVDGRGIWKYREAFEVMKGLIEEMRRWFKVLKGFLFMILENTVNFLVGSNIQISPFQRSEFQNTLITGWNTEDSMKGLLLWN